MLIVAAVALPMPAAAQAPAPPLALRAWKSGSNVHLQWEPSPSQLVDNIVQYNVYVLGIGGPALVAAVENTEYLVEGSTDLSIYYVTAVNGADEESLPSNPAVPLIPIPPWHCAPIHWYVLNLTGPGPIEYHVHLHDWCLDV